MIKKEENIESLTGISFLLLFVPAAIISAMCLFYRSEIMNLLYRSHINQSADILAVLMIGFLGISASYIFGTLLTANNNLKELNILAGASVILNVLLNFVLIPRYFALGSAIASMVTQLIMALAQVILVYRKFSFSLNHVIILRLVIFMTLVFLSGWLFNSIELTWYLGIILLGFAGLAFSFILQLVNPKSLYQIIRFGDETE